MNKDKVNRLYVKYKGNVVDEAQVPYGLECLMEAEARARRELEVEREKQEIERRLIELLVGKRTLTFEQRRGLFISQD
jgi:hypothetical protein